MFLSHPTLSVWTLALESLPLTGFKWAINWEVSTLLQTFWIAEILLATENYSGIVRINQTPRKNNPGLSVFYIFA